MKVGEPIVTGPNHCLNCGERCDGATAVGVEGEVRPSPGDATVCIYCGHVMAFDKAMRFRELTSREMIALAGDGRLVAINTVRRRRS